MDLIEINFQMVYILLEIGISYVVCVDEDLIKDFQLEKQIKLDYV